MHDISEVLDDDDRCLLVVIAKRVVDQDLCDLVRIEALALAKDGCSLEVIDVCNDSAVCACFLLDSFADIVRIGRAVYEALVERRHGACDIIDQGCLTAAGIEYAAFPEYFGDSAENEGEEHVPFPSSSIAACMP